MTCDHIHDSGPYVLGAMSPAERESYERHLTTCPTCRAEVTDLAGLPGLLGRLDLASALAITSTEDPIQPADAQSMEAHSVDARTVEGRPADPRPVETPVEVRPVEAARSQPPVPPEDIDPAHAPRHGRPDPLAPVTSADPLLPRILDRARKERRRQRRRHFYQLSVSTVLAAALAVLVVLGVRGGGINPPATVDFTAMRQMVATSPVTAEVALEPYAGGTRVHVQCAYQDGQGDERWQFSLVAVPKQGQGPVQELNNWTSGYGDQAEITGHTVLKPAQIERIELRRSDGLPLLVYDVT